MCLSSEILYPLIADKEISCYKVLVPVGGNLYTPYRDFCFPLGEVIVDKEEENSRIMWGIKMIESGYFHAYLNLEAAKDLVKCLYRKYKMKSKIYNAIIPKDSPYYIGQYEDICSKSLKIIEECFD